MQGPIRFKRSLIAVSLLASACGAPTPPPQPPTTRSQPLRDEIPTDQLSAVIEAHFRGLGAMERYEYKAAAEAFRDVHRRAPGWIEGTVNLSIALLNLGGEGVENAKQAGEADAAEASDPNIVTARKLLDEVIKRQPDQPYALFSRGIILQSQGDIVAAHNDFARVTQLDPHDPHAWYEYGETMTDPARPGMPLPRDQEAQRTAAFAKALEADPYLVTVMYKLQQAYRLAGEGKRAGELLTLWNKLNPKRNAAGAGETATLTYGEMGKYAQVKDSFRPKGAAETKPPPPRFGPADLAKVDLPPGDRWAGAVDYVGPLAIFGRAQQRFGAGVATFDVNRDGLLDIYLAAAVIGPRGLRDVLLINQGQAIFADATLDYGLPPDRASLGVAASDFDADLQVDLYLTGPDDNRLFRQDGKKFVDITRAAGVAVEGAISLTARWFDIDQDGDLDLYVINHAAIADRETAFAAGSSGKGMPNSVFRNDGKPAPVGQRPEDNWAPVAAAPADLPARQGLSVAFSTGWPRPEVLQGGTGRHTSFAALDIDEDRDIDLVLSADDEPPVVLLNDRAGLFHASPLGGWTASGRVSGLLVTDFDQDGRPDLVATVADGPGFAWRNTTKRLGSAVTVAGQSFPSNVRNWLGATTIDLDLDTRPDLIGSDGTAASSGLAWARGTGSRFESRLLALGPMGDGERPTPGCAAANVIGDPLPDLIMRRDGEAPRIATNLGNGLHWLAIDLSGRWKMSFDQMRTNSEGLGTRLALEGQGLYTPFDYTTIEAGTAQSSGPFVLGMGTHLMAPLLRIRWPDSVMQSELNVTADKVLQVAELNRKTGSCPILFTWNGERFVCWGDFAGAAGLGFLEAPGEYHPPDRDESLAISSDQLKPVDDVYRLSIVEPMDEVAYLDRFELEVVDRPPAIQTALDERFAFGGSQPTGDLIAWRNSRPPVAAHDHAGRDVLALVRHSDRRSVDQFARINGWAGYTEDHGLILDFGSLDPSVRPPDDLTLCLTGWVEYPYSQTNYAAAGAGVSLHPPVLEQEDGDGRWRVIDPGMGHPAGLTRMMTVDLAGKVFPAARLRLRIKTNMECYWDQAFLAVRDVEARAQLRTTRIAVANARLRDRGYLRESSPDGQQPILPDYDHIDPSPLARLQGELTRHGDVTPLLQGDDDRLCVMGPGDEVQLEFDAACLPPLPSGWTRCFVLRTVAYCKDADPFTATSDSVGPLPWRGMPAFPFPEGQTRPLDPAYSHYLREYQTRPAGAR